LAVTLAVTVVAVTLVAVSFGLNAKQSDSVNHANEAEESLAQTRAQLDVQQAPQQRVALRQNEAMNAKSVRSHNFQASKLGQQAEWTRIMSKQGSDTGMSLGNYFQQEKQTDGKILEAEATEDQAE